MRALLAAAVLACIAALPAAAAEPCKYGVIAELPVTMRGLRPLVPAKINGGEVKFILDSGAFFSTLAERDAKRLKVTPVAGGGVDLEGVGGRTHATVGKASEFFFAGVPIKNVQFVLLDRSFDSGAVGLLGQNVLGLADVEYDLAKGVVRLLKVMGDCGKTDLGYWAPNATNVLTIDHWTPQSPHTIGRAKVNGREIKVLFDTGATTSFLSRSAAQRAGVKLQDAEVRSGGVGGGIGDRLVETFLAPVESFGVGSETVKNTRLRVADTPLGFADMLLGADFFLSHRILVSKSQRRLYFTYNGGPVFRLDQAADSPATPTTAAAAPAAEKLDAAGWSRRGAAALARRDFKGAVDAFSQAIALEPKDAQHYRERARARAGAKQRSEALDDYAKALELSPGDSEALLRRAALRIEDEPQLARKDLEAAVAAAPKDQATLLGAAAVYQHGMLYGPALELYDRWLASGPPRDQRWEGLNSRCWTRALSGRDLDKALADCNAALAGGGRSSSVLDSRGLVNLRMGRLKEAMADYDAALKLQPRLAWSLYGRGVAKRKLGDAKGGDADIRLALSFDSEVADEAKRIGLTD